jgi:hypothetical protein
MPMIQETVRFRGVAAGDWQGDMAIDDIEITCDSGSEDPDIGTLSKSTYVKARLLSGWQSSLTYTDSGLDGSTQYTYTVKMRDSVQNVGTPWTLKVRQPASIQVSCKTAVLSTSCWGRVRRVCGILVAERQLLTTGHAKLQRAVFWPTIQTIGMWVSIILTATLQILSDAGQGFYLDNIRVLQTTP